jgi:hypothetical protein
MNHISKIKLAAANALLCMLAACGGGGSAVTPDKPLPEVQWGSPAVFVTPGQASASFNLTGCTLLRPNVNPASLYQAKLMISDQGDVSIVATTSDVATATTEKLAGMAFADAAYVNWRVFGTVETPTYSIEMYKPRISEDLEDEPSSIRVNYQSFENAPVPVYSKDEATGVEINGCVMAEPLALKTAVNQARVAKHMGYGVSEIDVRVLSTPGESTYTLPYGITGEVASWSTPPVTLFGDFPQQNYQFNLATGSLKQSTGTDTAAPLSDINLSLPTLTNEGSFGLYNESVCRNSAFYESKEAKSLVAIRLSSSELTVDSFANTVFATRYGNKLMPLHSLFAFFGINNGSFDNRVDCLPRDALNRLDL